MAVPASRRLVDGLAALVAERGGPGLIFVDQRAEAQEMAAALQEELGFEVAWVTAERSKAERAKLADRMRHGQLQLAVCTAAWSTGLDIPCLRFVILAGRGKAPIGVLQSVGRALRLAGGKEGYEILNVSTAETRGNASRRAELLEEYGFEVESEERFLDELDEQDSIPEPEPTVGQVCLALIYAHPRLAIASLIMGLLNGVMLLLG
jgi:superfamily II DNA or RNA helicase